MKLNLGCGLEPRSGWINVDYAFGARLMRSSLFRMINRYLNICEATWSPSVCIHDLTRQFPWKDNSVDVIYSSHMLEHFTREEGQRFLSECFRVLRQGGAIRILVPDFSCVARKYIDRELSAVDFLEAVNIEPQCPKLFSLDYYRHRYSSHKCMYDENDLNRAMIEAGFLTAIKKPFESVVIPDISSIEVQKRVEKSVIVEGQKASHPMK